jgi:hypothetical protein
VVHEHIKASESDVCNQSEYASGNHAIIIGTYRSAPADAYLDEHGVDDGVAGGGDGRRDDAEAQRLQRPADLGDDVPAPAAPHAHHRHFLPGLRNYHLHNLLPFYISFFVSWCVSSVGNLAS